MKNETDIPALVCHPIGYVKTTMSAKFDAPHQANDSDARSGIIELVSDPKLEVALRDLSGFSHLWLIWWFHRNSTWRPTVLPPRGPATRRGVFATRSPHRPNPIGITAVRLLEIRGRQIMIGECDLVDGTPILDIKPYLPSVDAHPDALTGWLSQVEATLAATPRFSVRLTDLAREQIAWLRSHWGIDFIDRATKLLSIDPSPHRSRRISKRPEGIYRMGCGAWRVWFLLEETSVEIQRISCGYPLSTLTSEGYDRVPDREAQISFYATYEGLPQTRR